MGIDIAIGKDNIFKDDVLAPDPLFTFTFKGKNPAKIVNDISGLLEDAYGMDSNDFGSHEIKWDASGAEVSFFGLWTGKIPIDNYSTLFVDVRAVGKEDKNTKEGEVTIVIHPFIQTKYSVETSLQRTYLKIWTFFYHDKRRMAYIEDVRKQTNTLKNILYGKYGLGVNVQ